MTNFIYLFYLLLTIYYNCMLCICYIGDAMPIRRLV